MLLLLAVAVWILLVVAMTMKLRDSHLSDYELQRRGEHEALRARALRPQLDSLRMIISTFLSVILVTILVSGFGWLNGVLIATAALLVAPLGRRLSLLCKLGDTLLSKYQSEVLGVVEKIKPMLSWLRDRDVALGEPRVYSKDELRSLVERSHIYDKEEMLRFLASLKFSSQFVRDVMTPRSMIETADLHDGLGPLVLDSLHKTGHSRFPVIDKDIDHVVGMLYLRELIDLKSHHPSVKNAMDPKVYYIHQDQSLDHALHGFLRTHHHLFIVVNEYRETVGVIGLEDVIEALLGHTIIDEFDQFDDLRAVAASNPRANNQPKGKKDI